MVLGFLDHMRRVPDHRIPGMTTFPLHEVLLAVLVGVVCEAEDWQGVEAVAESSLDWLRGFLPFAAGVPTAQTFRKIFPLLDKRALEENFAAWASSVRFIGPEVVPIEGKTFRGSKTAKD